MKKIFTLIATALMAVSVNAQTDPIVYDFAGIKADDIIVDANSEVGSRSFDGVDCPMVKYNIGNSEKTLIQIKQRDFLTLQYANSDPKDNIVTFAPEFMNVDTKNFVFLFGNNDTDLKLKANDVIKVKFSAKGDKSALLHAETNVKGDDVESKEKDEIKIASFTVEANGTCKIKEMNGGVRIYAIAINADIPAETAGISEFASASKVSKARKVVVNGRLVIETANGTFSTTGARVK